MEHIRLQRTMAELVDCSNSEEEATVMTQVANSPLEKIEVEEQQEVQGDSDEYLSTSSSSLYAIFTPSPVMGSASPISSDSDPRTITEQVQLHNPPPGSQDQLIIMEADNNTSCSLSSTLTDSKTLDGRTPIVV
ncbi:probable G-protein coupled receptor CG31760 [Drosophila willistoni]|nr:probable G-protein coupled receptor CG31760 [Drosophila willistoni]